MFWIQNEDEKSDLNFVFIIFFFFFCIRKIMLCVGRKANRWKSLLLKYYAGKIYFCRVLVAWP